MSMARSLNRKKKNKKNKNKNKNKAPAEPEELTEELTEENLMAIALEMIQNLAYFDCIHTGMEKACCQKGEEFFGMFSEHDKTFLDGWEEATEAFDYLPNGEIPPAPLYVYFPSSGVSARPGQVVFTENVRGALRSSSPFSHVHFFLLCRFRWPILPCPTGRRTPTRSTPT